MDTLQASIIVDLNVVPAFAGQAALAAEVERRILFIQDCLRHAELKTLVLGISGGVDSLVAGRLAQLAVSALREQSGDAAYHFIAVRLPYHQQQDEADAQAALNFIDADEVHTVNIADAVNALAGQTHALGVLSPAKRDFAMGNIKARMRMLAQYAIANAHNGMVIGTDHAAEAVMGFFTKFGDGACDLAPLSGLVKHQVRGIAQHLGAPDELVFKVPTADLEELKPGKPDEEAYGVTYAEIDGFLHGQQVSEQARQRITHAYANTKHKRRPPLAP